MKNPAEAGLIHYALAFLLPRYPKTPSADIKSHAAAGSGTGLLSANSIVGPKYE